MEGDLVHLTDKELEEKIRELEHAYAEFFEGNAHARDLHIIRKTILELQRELDSRKNN